MKGALLAVVLSLVFFWIPLFGYIYWDSILALVARIDLIDVTYVVLVLSGLGFTYLLHKAGPVYYDM